MLALLSIGATRADVLGRLAMTEDEWDARLQLIREEAKPGDALLFWARFQAATAVRMAALSRALAVARDGAWEEVPGPDGRPIRKACVVKPNPFAVAALVGKLAELDRAVLEKGLQLGIIRPELDGGPAGSAAAAPPPLSSHATFIVNILEQAGQRADLAQLTEAQLLHALERTTREFQALVARPRPPLLMPEGPRRGS